MCLFNICRGNCPTPSMSCVAAEDPSACQVCMKVKVSAPQGICMNGIALCVHLPRGLCAPELATINGQCVLLNQSCGYLCFPCVVNCMGDSILYEIQAGWNPACGPPRGKDIRVVLLWCDACCKQHRLHCKVRI